VFRNAFQNFGRVKGKQRASARGGRHFEKVLKVLTVFKSINSFLKAVF